MEADLEMYQGFDSVAEKDRKRASTKFGEGKIKAAAISDFPVEAETQTRGARWEGDGRL